MSFTDEHEMTPMTARFAAALYWFWFVRGHKEEQIEWLGQLLGLPDIGSDDTILGLMMAYAWFLLWNSEYETLQAHLVDTKGMAERLGREADLAMALVIEGWLHQNLEQFDRTEEYHDLALEIAQKAGDDLAIGWAAYGRGWIDRMRADVDSAAPFFDLAIAKMRHIGDTLGLAWASAAGAILARYRLDFDTAQQLHEESLDNARLLGDRGLQSFNYACMGIVEFHRGNFEEAIALHQKCADLERDIGSTGAEVAENLHLMADAQLRAGRAEDAKDSVFETLSTPLLDNGQEVEAARLWGWATATREKVGRAVPPPSRPLYVIIEERIEAAVPEHKELAADAAEWSYQEALAEGKRALTLF
jgi:tetratricopeptide (TPR) repeat protein